MKIEIGESIIYSWLRHIKKCQVVQLNWKTSPEWLQVRGNTELQRIMDKTNIEFNNPFKKTQHLSQLFRQAEIDAIGINIEEDSIYAVDIAFHEGGLSYGDKYETSKRITKKIIRTILILQQYFQKIPNHKILFISPKVNPEPLSVLKQTFDKISRFIEKESLQCEIGLISNEDFEEKILIPICDLSSNVADTSELFLRSVQLTNLFSDREQGIQKRIKAKSAFLEQATNENNQKTNEVRKEIEKIRRKVPKWSITNESSEEIKKIRRKVPKWFSTPTQYNSRILTGYLELAEHKSEITVTMLKNKCTMIPDFYGNYNQMKNFGEKNHGKVFEEVDQIVFLWEPVKKFILEEYKK